MIKTLKKLRIKNVVDKLKKIIQTNEKIL